MRTAIDIYHKTVQEPADLVILADVSGSMSRDRKYERLRRELLAIWGQRPARLMAFASDLHWCDSPHDLPAPYGSTYLDGALLAAAELWPGEVLVVSDGLPDNTVAALEAAKKVPGVISVLFVGSDEEQRGAEFLRQLATLSGGMFIHKDLAKHTSLASELRSMLALPPPISL